ncbi:general amidase [Trametopsis cervina]|nr:general amidase [Trametopsis cervina]
MSTHWKDLVAEKRARRAAAIPKDWIVTPPPETVLDVTNFPDECGLLTSQEKEITNTVDVAVLLANLATAKWSSVEVTTAFYKRAIIAQQLVNCLTEIFVERALARAAELDAHLKATGKVLGPLHGLPISLKDQFRIKGLETTMGYVSWIGKYAEEDSVLVQILYDAGAVPFVQTNVPQTLMWPETYNKIYGRTLNPHNRALTSGGSSGGEGALVGLKGSPLGIGSDIGGSIRIPSSFNGIYGLRSSYGRIPYAGAVNSCEGQESILSVFGPLSHSLNGIKLFMQAVAASQPWLRDPLARRAPWNDDLYQLKPYGGGKQLCFGIMWDDRQVVPHPPITLALELTKAALLAAGHKVIEWKPYKHKEILLNVYKIWTAGADQDYKKVTSATGEPILNSMDLSEEEITSELNAFLPPIENVSAYDMWQVHLEKRTHREEYLKRWNETVNVTGTGRPMDAIIAPVSAGASAPHGFNKSAAYTGIWNALDYPACAFPVGKVDPARDVKRSRHDFLGDSDREHYELYEPHKYANAPTGLQLVGRCQEEEAVIAMTGIVADALKRQQGGAARL